MATVWQMGRVTSTNVWDMGSEGAYSGTLSISAVSGDGIFRDGDTSITVTGTDLDTITSAIIETDDSAYQVDVTASYSASDAGNATFNHSRGAVPLTTASYQLRLRLSDGTSTVYEDITILPATGYQVVELAGTLVLTDPESLFAPYTGPDPVAGDQYIVPLTSTETAPITANADSTADLDYTSISPVPETDSFSVEWWSSDGSSRVWSSGTINIDEELPVVTSVGVPSNATYSAGQNLDFTVNTSETVVVDTGSGTPSIPVTVGATVRQATYLSGTGSSALVFRYTVVAGEFDDDGVVVGSSIALNGGTIQDQAGNDAVLTLNSIGSTTGVLVDSLVPPAGTITFGAPTKTGTTITQPFVYSASDQTGFEYRVDSGSWVALAASPVSLTGLTANTSYDIDVRPVNADGEGTPANTSVTTEATAAPPAGTVTIGTITQGTTTATVPFTYSASDQTGFEYRIDAGSWVAIAASPISLTGLTANTSYYIVVRAVNNDGSGTAASDSFTTDALNPPQGVVTFGTPTTTKNLATIPFTYDLADQSGFEYRVDGGSWVALSGSPVALSGLTPDTSYLVEVRAVNSNGASTEFPITVTTQALAVPAGVITFQATTVGQTTASIPFTYSSSDQTGFQYRVDGGSWISIAASPVFLTSLNPSTSYTIEVVALNNDGLGTIATTAITTLAEQSTVDAGTSGTYDFNMAVEEIIEDAYERIGVTTNSGYDLRSARRSLNLLLTEWVNKQITLWTTERRSIQCVAGQASYDLRQYDVDAFEVALRTSGADLVLTRVSMDQSMYTVDKDQPGKPTQYWFDREIIPKLVLWPVPDNNNYTLIVDVFKYIQDAGQYYNYVGAPRRFLPAMVAGLAYLLAEKKAPQLVAEKKALYNEILNEALAADEEVKTFTVRPAYGSRHRRRR